MIDLYSTGFGASPNVFKVILALEEMGLPYRIFPIHIEKGEQFAPAFLDISPNNRVPAIVDHAPADGGARLAVFESGAVLTYLADKVGRFLPPASRPRARSEVLQWVHWQGAGFGPNIGQFIHFAVYAPEKVAYAVSRFGNEINRLFGVAERRLAQSPWLGGTDYSIADMMTFASTRDYHRLGQDMSAFPAFEAWHARIRERPACLRAYRPENALQETVGAAPYLDGDAWKTLFGQTAATIRERSARPDSMSGLTQGS